MFIEVHSENGEGKITCYYVNVYSIASVVEKAGGSQAIIYLNNNHIVIETDEDYPLVKAKINAGWLTVCHTR